MTLQNLKYLEYEITVSIQYKLIVKGRSCLSNSYSCSCVVLEEGTQKEEAEVGNLGRHGLVPHTEINEIKARTV